MPDPWFEVAAAETPLSQGDLIEECPLLGWRKESVPMPDNVDATFELASMAESFTNHAIMMSQACDLERGKVVDVVLCPAISLTAFHIVWERRQQANGQAANAKSRKRELMDIASGRMWNLSLLSSYKDNATESEIRVVYFGRVFTLPRNFLESFLRRRGQTRLRLRSPYREHLSQSFARFFMQVGLPQAIVLPN